MGRQAINGTQGSFVHHWGWKDLLSVVEDPSIVNYTTRTPQADLAKAFRARWMNCVNQAGPLYVQQALAEGYTETFGSMPFFIGEYGALWQTASKIEEDLRAMDEMALDDSTELNGFNLLPEATHRAQAVESAWNGSLVAPGICQASSTSPGTRRLRGVATPAVLV